MTTPHYPLRSVPPLVQETPPTQPTIDIAILSCLDNTLNSAPRLENSLYGDFNDTLQSLFPIRRRFTVKPQGVLRERREVQADSSFESTDSVDSALDIVLPAEGGGYVVPDFMIIKNRIDPPVRIQAILSIIEIKNQDSFVRGRSQLYSYLRLVQGKPYIAEKVKAFLVFKKRTYEYQLSNSTATARIQFVDSYPTLATNFQEALHEIAKAHWN